MSLLEINKTGGLNLGEDWEYIATFLKGKKASELNPRHYRLLFKGVNTGKEAIFFLQPRPDFFGRNEALFLEFLDEFKYITPDHIKNKCYNYYKLSTDPKYVHNFFKLWKKSDPMIHTGNFIHQFMSNIKNYIWTYKFEGKEY